MATLFRERYLDLDKILERDIDPKYAILWTNKIPDSWPFGYRIFSTWISLKEVVHDVPSLVHGIVYHGGASCPFEKVERNFYYACQSMKPGPYRRSKHVLC